MSNRIASGNVLEAHIGIESAFGAGFTQSASTALAALASSSVDLQDRDLLANEEATGSRDSNDKLSGRYKPFAVKVDAYARLQKDAGSASQIEPLIQAALGASARQTPSGKTVGIGATTTVIPVTTGTDFQLFDGVVIGGHPRIVTKVEAAQITIAPPLPTAPAQDTPITVTRTLHQAAVQPTFGFDLKRDHTAISAKGCVVKKLSISGDASKEVRVSVDAEGASQITTGTTALAAAVADNAAGDQTWTFVNASVFSVGSLFDVGTEKGVLVKSINTANNTAVVTRPGSGRSTHSIGDECVPSWTAGSASGDIGVGMNGFVSMLDATGALISVPAVSRGVDFDTGSALVNDEDGSTGPTYKFDDRRGQASIKSKIHFRSDDARFVNLGQNRGVTPVIYWVTAGSRGMAIAAPRAEFTIPKINPGKMVDLDLTMEVTRGIDADGNRVNDRSLIVFTW